MRKALNADFKCFTTYRTMANRIMIIGQPGSGKSTLARAMGEITHLPVVHIDNIHWQPGWIERSQSEKERLCLEVHAREQWIFEGGQSSTWSQRLARADTLIWLDFPLWLRSLRVIRRTLKYHGKSRPDLPEDCPERFNWEFTRWIWDTRKTGRARMLRLYQNAPTDKTKHRLGNKKQVEEYLLSLTSVCSNSVAQN